MTYELNGEPQRKSQSHDQRIRSGARVRVSRGDFVGRTGTIVDVWSGIRGVTVLLDPESGVYSIVAPRPTRLTTGHDHVEILEDAPQPDPSDVDDSDDSALIMYGAPFC
jgi:transcription antitermination factor NusG